MSEHKVKTTWQEGLRFIADIDGHKITMDVPERVGGTNQGTIPKPLLLAALSGCTGMDVASILQKYKVPFDSLEVEVDAPLTTTKPTTYERIEVLYSLEGPETSKEPAIKAAQRSQDQMCGVAFLLKQALRIDWTMIFNGILVYTTKLPALQS